MLVLGRTEGESIFIGENIRITLVRSSSGKAKIGIEAPRDMSIVREELIAKANHIGDKKATPE